MERFAAGARYLFFGSEVGELRLPVVTLRVQLAGEIEQRAVAVAIVEPEHAQHFIVPAEDGPLLERTLVHVPRLVGEVFLHQRNHARVARGFLVLHQRLEHHVVRPPVQVLDRPDRAIGLLVVQRPVHPLLHLGDQHRILREIRQRHQAVQEIRARAPSLRRCRPARRSAGPGPARTRRDGRSVLAPADAVGRAANLSA